MCGAMIARSHGLVWTAVGGLAAAAIGGYMLTLTVGGFFGDHRDVGNWRCSKSAVPGGDRRCGH
jgi:hypothetical protein